MSEAIREYSSKIWGWDSGAIFFIPDALEDEITYTRVTLQDHPELMKKIIELCEEYFGQIDV